MDTCTTAAVLCILLVAKQKKKISLDALQSCGGVQGLNQTAQPAGSALDADHERGLPRAQHGARQVIAEIFSPPSGSSSLPSSPSAGAGWPSSTQQSTDWIFLKASIGVWLKKKNNNNN